MSTIIAEVTRGNVVETIHRGDAVVVNSEGQIVAWVGDPTKFTFMRSSAKPIQALSVIMTGAAAEYGLTQRELAIICASHNAESFHVETVLSILEKAGVAGPALQCGTHPPIHKESARDLFKSGKEPWEVHCNCSGKHAGMLAVSKKMGFDLEGYLDRDHPVQQMVLERLEALASYPADKMEIGIDGCGVPVHAMPISNMALAFARLADPEQAPGGYGEAVRTIVSAMQAHPEMVAGTGRTCTDLIRTGEGNVVAKSGAQGVYCVGHLPSGLGIAVKAEDGNGRIAAAVALEIMRKLDLLTDKHLEDLEKHHRPVIKNTRGEVVGETRTVFALTRAAV